MVRRKRKKSGRCVGDGELRVDEGSDLHFKSLSGIPGINIHDGGFKQWVAVKPRPVSSISAYKMVAFKRDFLDKTLRKR